MYVVFLLPLYLIHDSNNSIDVNFPSEGTKSRRRRTQENVEFCLIPTVADFERVVSIDPRLQFCGPAEKKLRKLKTYVMLYNSVEIYSGGTCFPSPPNCQ